MSDPSDAWLKSSLLNDIPGLSHVFTTRLGGISEGPFASLNLKYPFSETDEQGGHARVRQNRQRVCDHLGLPLENLSACQQVHGKRIQVVTQIERGSGAFAQEDAFPETDGLITAEKEIPLMALTADCLPVLMADPIKKVCAAVHSGWRGTQQEVVLEAIRKMCSELGSKLEDIRLAIGPGIGFDSFEVGPDVLEAFGDAVNPDDLSLVQPGSQDGKYLLNLAEIVGRQALVEGLNPRHIEILYQDTFSDERLFYSYRRDQKITGRQAGLIGWR